MDSNTMEKKLLVITNKVGNEIQARIPKNIQDSSFLCFAYIKKLSNKKYIFFFKGCKKFKT